jgi:uncharacterized protein (TIGR02270 family)
MNPARKQSPNQATSSTDKNHATISNAFNHIFEQHVSDAAFLWVLLHIAQTQPHYTADDLYQLEQRINAHLDGLMTSPDQAWPLCEQALNYEEAGESFTAAVIAFRSLEINKIQRTVELGLVNEETTKGLISALAWLPEKLCHPWIEKFLSSKDLNHKYLAIAACSARRDNPGEVLGRLLERQDCRQHTKLYARCLRLIGELKLYDHVSTLNIAVQSENSDCVFWAAWSLVLLGQTTALPSLFPFVLSVNRHQQRAINLVFRAVPINKGRQLISTLAKDEQQVRNVIKASGVLGDPHAITWLVNKMQEPTLARLAGESFTFITGIDLEQQALTNELPDLTEQTPDDDSQDNNVELDEDENLPWPNSEKVAAVWQKYGGRFTAGQRYFLGQAIQSIFLHTVLTKGYQRQRNAAALELALLEANTPVTNTKAPMTNAE